MLRTIPYAPADQFTVKLVTPSNQSMTNPVRVVKTDLGGLPAAVFELGAGIRLDATKSWAVEFTSLPTALAEQVEIEDRTVTRLKREALDDFGVLLGYRLES